MTTRIIADACANHMGDMRVAEAMVDAAAQAGVDVVKWQAFHADRLNPSWPNYEAAKANYARLQFTSEQFAHLKSYCEGKGVEFLCTAFDLDAADMISKLGCDTVKIASPDSNNLPLLEKCLALFRKTIISTGMSTAGEMQQLLGYLNAKVAIRDIDRSKVAIMHCLSQYPAPLNKVDMGRMLRLRETGFEYGYSDHSIALEPAKLAIALGASYIERHLTLSRDLPGKDQQISTLPDGFYKLALWRDAVDMLMKPNTDAPSNRQYIDRWAGVAQR